MNIKNIFFDFDGVILDSVECKTNAFTEIYKQYGNDVMSKVKDYHLNNGGVSRFEKFRYWHKNFLNIQLNDEQLNNLCNKFSKLVFDKVVNSRPVPGSINFIREYSNKYSFWIITGTPTNEMIQITKEIGIFNHFNGIFGSPKNKSYWVKFLLDEYNINPDETIFLGDAMSDYLAAKKYNIKFILRKTKYNNLSLSNRVNYTFEDYKQLKKIIL